MEPRPSISAEAREAKEHFRAVTRSVCDVVERPMPRLWLPAFAISLAMLGMLVISIIVVLRDGIGSLGNNNTEAWAWPMVNFVFWLGVAQAGVLISAAMFLARQKWRTTVSRTAEAVTLFAVICAAVFLILHSGRPWVSYWLLPLPNDMALWPQFRSPLAWDVAAVAIFFCVAAMFSYMGLVPDLATLRDRATTRRRAICYGVLALGWRSSARQWHRFERAYMIMAGLSVVLAICVHSIASMSFAATQLPGWHTTIFPPYFVVGAAFSGFALVLALVLGARAAFGLGDLISPSHVDAMCKIVLATGTLVAFALGIEYFIAWYSGNLALRFVLLDRAFGPYSWIYQTMLLLVVFAPQLFWFARLRASIPIVIGVCVLVTVGTWLERFVIVVTSQSRPQLSASWSHFSPTLVDVTLVFGSIGLFSTLLLLFIRYLPAASIASIKGDSTHSAAGTGDGDEE